MDNRAFKDTVFQENNGVPWMTGIEMLTIPDDTVYRRVFEPLSNKLKSPASDIMSNKNRKDTSTKIELIIISLHIYFFNRSHQLL